MDNYMLKNAIIHIEDLAKWIVAHQEVHDWLTAAEIKNKKNQMQEVLHAVSLSVSLNNQWYGTSYSFLTSFVSRLADKILTKYSGKNAQYPFDRTIGLELCLGEKLVLTVIL